MTVLASCIIIILKNALSQTSCPSDPLFCLWHVQWVKLFTGSTEARPLSVVHSLYTSPESTTVVLGTLLATTCPSPFSTLLQICCFWPFWTCWHCLHSQSSVAANSRSSLWPIPCAEGSGEQLFHHIQLIYCLRNCVNFSSLPPHPRSN